MGKRSVFQKNNIFDWVVNLLVFFVICFTLYPIIYVFSNSISSGEAVLKKEVWLYPIGFNLASYKQILQHQYIPTSYMNSIIYTSIGTAYSLVLTILGAYPLSRKNLPGKNAIMLFIAFTMLFGGGLIPTYLVVKDLDMINKIWAMFIPCAISQYNLIIMRTNFQQIPDSLEESAKIDGANDFTILLKIILPMSIPVLCTIGLFYGIAKWNDFFTAMIYLNEKKRYPLQLIMRELLITMSDTTMNQQAVGQEAMRNLTPLGFKSAAIIASMVPLMIVYPLLQRFFVKGVMIGAIKG